MQIYHALSSVLLTSYYCLLFFIGHGLVFSFVVFRILSPGLVLVLSLSMPYLAISL
jgi:hypothetical protein